MHPIQPEVGIFNILRLFCLRVSFLERALESSTQFQIHKLDFHDFAQWFTYLDLGETFLMKTLSTFYIISIFFNVKVFFLLNHCVRPDAHKHMKSPFSHRFKMRSGNPSNFRPYFFKSFFFPSLSLYSHTLFLFGKPIKMLKVHFQKSAYFRFLNLCHF